MQRAVLAMRGMKEREIIYRIVIHPVCLMLIKLRTREEGDCFCWCFLPQVGTALTLKRRHHLNHRQGSKQVRSGTYLTSPCIYVLPTSMEVSPVT